MSHEEKGDPAEIAKLKGWAKHFNTLTTRGRINIVCATYGTIAFGWLIYKLRNTKVDKPSTSS